MKRLAIFAGYDKHGIIDDYVLFYLKELKKVADIVFVYDTEFSEEELKKVEDLTIHQICEKHGEYDFGSYKRGYVWAKENNILENYNQLVFCNDSVYGPFYALDSIFEAMDKKKNNDFWSVFFERDYAYIRTKRDYCQSYFLVFNKQVFTSSVFSNFISGIKKLKDKDKIIECYELELSQILLKNGFKCSGFMSSPYNAPHDRKAMKIIEAGFPFIKRSLFDRGAINANCFKLKDYKKIISKTYPNYNLNYIDKHLFRFFEKYDVEYVLSRRFGHFNAHIFHRKFLRFKGGFTKKEKYQFKVSLFGLSCFKITIPDIIVLHK